MYPASSSSSHHSTSAAGTNLLRYGSAPSSFLNAAVDSVVNLGIGSGTTTSAAVSSSTTTTTTHCFSVIHDAARINNESTAAAAAASRLHSGSGRSYNNSIGIFGGGFGANEQFGSAAAAAAGVSSSSSSGNYTSAVTAVAQGNLIRHSSSPAGLLNRLASDIGFAVTKGYENCSTSNGHKLSRLSSQLSFTKAESSPHIFDVSENVTNGSSSGRGPHSSPMAGFSLGPWDNSNPIMFNAPQTKRAKHMNGDSCSDFSMIESQYNLAHTALDLASMENFMHIPEDSVPCKIRAKRGCATHPRSIAERERRTRISGKLKKLQELVPNMDKQTSYADMLDLAVQHIKGLQTQIQQLNKEQEHCKCGSKQSTQR